MKILLRILRWAGIQQYMILYQTKKHRRAEMRMGAREYIQWIATMTINTASINNLTTEVILREIKRSIANMKEGEKIESDKRREQETISDPIDDNSDSNDGKHPAEFGK